MSWLTVCSFWMSLNKDALAPPIKQKARFKIKDAKCHLRPRNKEKHRDSSRQNVQGKTKSSCLTSLNLSLNFTDVCVLFLQPTFSLNKCVNSPNEKAETEVQKEKEKMQEADFMALIRANLFCYCWTIEEQTWNILWHLLNLNTKQCHPTAPCKTTIMAKISCVGETILKVSTRSLREDWNVWLRGCF